MINLVGVPLLMGVGDNFGIFVIDALRRQRRDRLPAEELASHLAASARAITLTSFTAILGFGSLMFTSTPAIQSLGRLTALGVSGSLAGTFFIVMPITFLIARRRERRS
jgi:predicted RND superfamily exporter protein